MLPFLCIIFIALLLHWVTNGAGNHVRESPMWKPNSRNQQQSKTSEYLSPRSLHKEFKNHTQQCMQYLSLLSGEKTLYSNSLHAVCHRWRYRSAAPPVRENKEDICRRQIGGCQVDRGCRDTFWGKKRNNRCKAEGPVQGRCKHGRHSPVLF